MNDNARKPDRPWPPLISADHIPRWVRRRDFALTCLMWILFAIMLETEFELFAGRFLYLSGLLDLRPDANWPEFFERLLPFVLVDVALIALLMTAGLLTLRRRRLGLLVPPPPPLGIADQARRAGMDEAALAAARELRIAVVHVEKDGSHVVKPR